MFQSLRPNNQIYILKKDVPSLEVGSVVSVSNPIPKYPTNFGQPQETILDLVVKINGQDVPFQKIPANLDAKKYFDPTFGVWNNDEKPKKIELLFSHEIGTYIAERTWNETQEIRENDDGSVYLSFESNQMQELKNWILHFGKVVTVINPPELIAQIKEEIQLIAEKY